MCTSYKNSENVFVEGFNCPTPKSKSGDLYCCGFNHLKYCCSDPNSYLPYESGYMWWLSIEHVVILFLLVIFISSLVLYVLSFFIKPGHKDYSFTELEAAPESDHSLHA